MYSERTTIVGVKKNGDYLELTTPSNDLYVSAKSGEVLLQWQTHDEYDGVTTKYARLTEAFWNGVDDPDNWLYEFKFDNGETYEADGNPYAEMESDADEPAPSGGGSGGGYTVTYDTPCVAEQTKTGVQF